MYIVGRQLQLQCILYKAKDNMVSDECHHDAYIKLIIKILHVNIILSLIDRKFH